MLTHGDILAVENEGFHGPTQLAGKHDRHGLGLGESESAVGRPAFSFVDETLDEVSGGVS